MFSWNVLFVDDDKFELINGHLTLVTFGKKVNMIREVKDMFIARLMSEMEDAQVPIAYSSGLREVTFTRMTKDVGEYLNGVIRVSTTKEGMRNAAKILVHELAHHVDFSEDITSDERLVREKTKKAKFMSDGYSRKDVGEYWACGNEVFYFGDEKAKKKLRKKNPYLFKKISLTHHKFAKMT
jgi:hypothetical protein